MKAKVASKIDIQKDTFNIQIKPVIQKWHLYQICLGTWHYLALPVAFCIQFVMKKFL